MPRTSCARPLTALIGELEVALLQAERPPAEYRRVLQRTLDSARQLNNLTNGLLQIARASDDPSQVPMAAVRLDELLLQAHEQLLRRHPTCRVDLDFGEADEPAAFTGARQRGPAALGHAQRAGQCLQVFGWYRAAGHGHADPRPRPACSCW